MTGATAKTDPLLCSPPLLTTTLPVVAPVGTATTILVSDQLVIVADCPLKVTVPALAPKLVPVIVIEAPGAPLDGVRLVMAGASTVKAIPLLDNVPAVTTTLPFVAPLGTTAVMLVLVQFVADAACPLNVIVPVVPVKLLPAIVIDAPGSPLDGRPLRAGIQAPSVRSRQDSPQVPSRARAAPEPGARATVRTPTQRCCRTQTPPPRPLPETETSRHLLARASTPVMRSVHETDIDRIGLHFRPAGELTSNATDGCTPESNSAV